MKVMRFLLGLAIGAGVALLVAPKSGRELRQQLAGGASGKLLGAAPDEYPQPEPVAEWGGAATAVAEAPGRGGALGAGRAGRRRRGRRRGDRRGRDPEAVPGVGGAGRDPGE